jgi:hypothetical protein
MGRCHLSLKPGLRKIGIGEATVSARKTSWTRVLGALALLCTLAGCRSVTVRFDDDATPFQAALARVARLRLGESTQTAHTRPHSVEVNKALRTGRREPARDQLRREVRFRATSSPTRKLAVRRNERSRDRHRRMLRRSATSQRVRVGTVPHVTNN